MVAQDLPELVKCLSELKHVKLFVSIVIKLAEDAAKGSNSNATPCSDLISELVL